MMCVCEICLRANVRMNTTDWLAWRAEMGWEQWREMDMEIAARLDDPR